MLVNIGNHNYIEQSNLVAVLEYKSAPVKRLIAHLIETTPSKVVDVTKGKKIETVLVMKDDFFILSPVGRKTIARRIGIYWFRTASEDSDNGD